MHIETRAYLEDDEIERFKVLTAAAKTAAKTLLDAEVEAVVQQLRSHSASPQHGNAIPRNLWDDLRLRRREGELSDQLEIELDYGDRDQRAQVLVHQKAMQHLEPWKIALILAAQDFELEFVSSGVQVARYPIEVTDPEEMEFAPSEDSEPVADHAAFDELLTAALFERIEAEQNRVDILAEDREYAEVDLVEHSIGSSLLGILQENSIYGWETILFQHLADILSGDVDDAAEALRDLVLDNIDGLAGGVAADLLAWEGMRDAMIDTDLRPFLESMTLRLNQYLG